MSIGVLEACCRPLVSAAASGRVLLKSTAPPTPRFCASLSALTMVEGLLGRNSTKIICPICSFRDRELNTESTQGLCMYWTNSGSLFWAFTENRPIIKAKNKKSRFILLKWFFCGYLVDRYLLVSLWKENAGRPAGLPAKKQVKEAIIFHMGKPRQGILQQVGRKCCGFSRERVQ